MSKDNKTDEIKPEDVATNKLGVLVVDVNTGNSIELPREVMSALEKLAHDQNEDAVKTNTLEHKTDESFVIDLPTIEKLAHEHNETAKKEKMRRCYDIALIMTEKGLLGKDKAAALDEQVDIMMEFDSTALDAFQKCINDQPYPSSMLENVVKNVMSDEEDEPCGCFGYSAELTPENIKKAQEELNKMPDSTIQDKPADYSGEVHLENLTTLADEILDSEESRDVSVLAFEEALEKLDELYNDNVEGSRPVDDVKDPEKKEVLKRVARLKDIAKKRTYYSGHSRLSDHPVDLGSVKKQINYLDEKSPSTSIEDADLSLLAEITWPNDKNKTAATDATIAMNVNDLSGILDLTTLLMDCVAGGSIMNETQKTQFATELKAELINMALRSISKVSTGGSK